MFDEQVSVIDLSPEDVEFDPHTIELFLEEKDMSQADLARLAGYKHRNAVNRIIRNKKKADATDLIKFSLIFGKPIQSFAKKV
jgi:plasmid maintenance system antidote protein VapI